MSINLSVGSTNEHPTASRLTPLSSGPSNLLYHTLLSILVCNLPSIAASALPCASTITPGVSLISILTSLLVGSSAANRKKFSRYGCASPSKHRSLINLLSRSLFFGSMPLTARLRISPPPHFSISLSKEISCSEPGRVVCV